MGNRIVCSLLARKILSTRRIHKACPFCGRTSINIKHHIEWQHPEKARFVVYGGKYEPRSPFVRPKTVSKDFDSLPKMMIEVQRK